MVTPSRVECACLSPSNDEELSDFNSRTFTKTVKDAAPSGVAPSKPQPNIRCATSPSHGRSCERRNTLVFSSQDVEQTKVTLPKPKIYAFCLFCALPLLCYGQNRTATSWLILPGGSKGGAITVQTTEADLVRIYGRPNVTATDVELGEGETEPGTELFSQDATRKIDILWKDAEAKRGPKSVRISGDKSLWRTVYGISLGTPLNRLEQLNRKPFRLAGFGWDYSGTVESWNSGALEQELHEVNDARRVILRLMPSGGGSQREYVSVLGDRTFSSGHPSMQKLNPTIYEIIWLFP
jgi:hypothetical protein